MILMQGDCLKMLEKVKTFWRKTHAFIRGWADMTVLERIERARERITRLLLAGEIDLREAVEMLNKAAADEQ